MKILSTSALAVIVAFGAIAGSAPSEAQETMTKEKLIGPWRLVSFKATAGDKVSYPLGEHPGGYVEITPTRYWLMAIDPTRKAPAAATLTDAEAISLMKSQVAYTAHRPLFDQHHTRPAPGAKLHAVRLGRDEKASSGFGASDQTNSPFCPFLI
jgi:hypothetical protein